VVNFLTFRPHASPAAKVRTRSFSPSGRTQNVHTNAFGRLASRLSLAS
jgi:hypothetical protein